MYERLLNLEFTASFMLESTRGQVELPRATSQPVTTTEGSILGLPAQAPAEVPAFPLPGVFDTPWDSLGAQVTRTG